MASGRSSRAKGVAGASESARVFQGHGFEVVKLQGNVLDAGDYTAALAGVRLLVETTRKERVNIHAKARQVEAAAHDGLLPALVYRRNAEPWRINQLLGDYCRTLEDFARLLGGTT